MEDRGLLTGPEIWNPTPVWTRFSQIKLAICREGQSTGARKVKWISSLLITCLGFSINRPPSLLASLPFKKQPQSGVVPFTGLTLEGCGHTDSFFFLIYFADWFLPFPSNCTVLHLNSKLLFYIKTVERFPLLPLVVYFKKSPPQWNHPHCLHFYQFVSGFQSVNTNDGMCVFILNSTETKIRKAHN